MENQFTSAAGFTQALCCRSSSFCGGSGEKQISLQEGFQMATKKLHKGKKLAGTKTLKTIGYAIKDGD